MRRLWRCVESKLGYDGPDRHLRHLCPAAPAGLIRLRAIMKEMAFVKIRLLVTVAMLLSSTLMGCHMESRNPPTSATLQVPMEEVLRQSTITQNVTMAVGNTLKLQLGSNYSTPYRWL